MKNFLKSIAKPKILVPIVFAVVLIGFVLSLGDIKKVGHDIVTFPRGSAAVFFLLVAIYEVVRFIQWKYLLQQMDIGVDLRRAIFAFVGGEATKSLPAGNYFENYLLEREEGISIAYTAASTTFTILLEVSVCVIYLAIVGISGWPWLRPLMIFGAVGVACLIAIVVKLDLHAHPPESLAKRKAFKWIGEQWKAFTEGAKNFLCLRVIAVAWGLAVLYLAAAGAAYYVVITALGGNVNFFEGVAAYLFGLGVGLILPVPTDIGVQEISGVGALKALGLQTTRAVSVTIIYRILNLVSSFVIAIVTFAILHRELRDAFSSRHGSGKVPGQEGSGEEGSEKDRGDDEQAEKEDPEREPAHRAG